MTLFTSGDASDDNMLTVITHKLSQTDVFDHRLFSSAFPSLRIVRVNNYETESRFGETSAGTKLRRNLLDSPAKAVIIARACIFKDGEAKMERQRRDEGS